jgi:type II secretory ATPase GspE/PulE/Tfp pilus assembly ATPase PilB-like protein
MVQSIAENEPVRMVDLVHALIDCAISHGASDIHIDPYESVLAVRYRIDGLLVHVGTLPLRLHKELIARIKVLAGMRTDEQFSVQDGRFTHKGNAREDVPHMTDVRMSIVPTFFGQNAVLRLLAKDVNVKNLHDLGFSDADSAKIIEAVKRSHGMCLVTGPTGSGKTTTLYSVLSLAMRPDISVVTIEDPIEYSIANVRQLEVSPRSGLNFANGLKAILRQGPRYHYGRRNTGQ